MVKHRLLIIDDEDAILFAVHDYFTRLGYEVDCADSVEQAETLLEGSRYETVLVDLRLSTDKPDEGLRLAERALQKEPASRVIIITAYGSPELEAEALRRGVHAFLHKPHPLRDLAQLIGCDPSAPGGSSNGKEMPQ